METIIQQTGEYLETRMELIRLKTISKSSQVVSNLLTRILLVAITLLFFSLFNIGVALWIGDSLGKLYYGFFLVAGFYAVAGVIFYLIRDRFIQEPISNLIISKFLD
jgi:hypothetical protein